MRIAILNGHLIDPRNQIDRELPLFIARGLSLIHI